MANEKTNPRRVPKTQADVDRALNEGRIQGAQIMLTCLVWLLCDKHDAPTEDLKQVSGEVQYLLESIAAGYVSFADIKRALKEEYNWEVNFYVGENVNRNRAQAR